MFSARVLRRRWVLAVFLLGFVLFIIYDKLNKDKPETVDLYKVQHTLLRQPFQWQPKVGSRDVESNSTSVVRCRNSVQGRQFIVDETGYVCERDAVTSRGCCEVRTPKTSRYNCSSCKSNGCCVVYEHCVSCCLQPQKQPVLWRILQQARDSVDKLFVSVSDHFELCLAKCRTSSRSVQHENSYRDPKAKFCYGEDPPDLQMVVT